jgi:ribosome recycling factor
MLKELEKEKEITEDDHRRCQEKVEEVTKSFIEQVDQILKKKEDEIMEV